MQELLAAWRSRPDDESLWAFAKRYSTATGLSFDAIRNRIRRWEAREAGAGEVVRDQPEHVAPEFVNLKRWEFDRREVDNLILQAQQVYRKADPRQDVVEIRIPTDSPIAIVQAGDFHLGSAYTNHEKLIADLDYIEQTPGLYYFDLGDDSDNFHACRSMESVFQQVIPPAMQRWWWEDRLQGLRGKLLGRCDDNHDMAFDEKVVGFSVWREVFREVPTFGAKGLIRLLVGEEGEEAEYRLLLTHKTKGHSNINPLHGVYREYRETFPADVVAGAHFHTFALSVESRYGLGEACDMGVGGEVIFAMIGSYKDDWYCRQWAPGVIAMPTIVFFPHQKRMLPFRNANDAMIYIEGWRGGCE